MHCISQYKMIKSTYSIGVDMKKVIDFIKEHNYLMILLIFIGFSISLSLTYSNFIVTSNNHKAAEMYIGELKYSIEIDGTTTNTLTVPAGETIIDVKVNNLNPVDTYYKLLYLNNSNLEIKYFSETKDTDEVKTNYKSPNDSVTSSNTNNLKLFIRNNSTTSQNVSFSLKGGYINNTLSDISVPSGYSEITTIEVPSSNTYFCKTDSTLTQGLEYVNGQYTYGYKKEGYYAPSRLAWSYISNNGWGVQLTDKASTDAVTSKLCTYINNKPVVSMSYMFLNSQAKALDLSNFDTSKVNNMLGMFWSSQATTLDISNFDTSNVTSMGSMFHISQATILDVSGFNTSKVTNMYNMFASSKAVTLDLSSFDTSNVTNMGYMFNNANNLKTIYVSSKFNIDTVTSSTNMFYGCTSLVGGSGTKYNSNYIDKTYARIDGGTSNPGYFTDIADKDIPAPNSFSTDSWKTIIKAVKNNNISKYNVGDTKEVDLGTTYGTHTIRITNMSTPSECSTSGFSQTACGFVLEFADIITTHNMNPAGEYNGTQYDYGYNVGGWPNSSMRTFVNNDIYNSLPSDLKNGIIDTTVVSSYGKSDTSNFTSTDKLYLLAPKEIYTDFNNSYDTAKDLTRQLDYYKNEGVTTSSCSKAIKINNSTASYWWLRSAKSVNISSFYFVYNAAGDWNTGTAYTTDGVSPAFRMG
jgi:surface protein